MTNKRTINYCTECNRQTVWKPERVVVQGVKMKEDMYRCSGCKLYSTKSHLEIMAREYEAGGEGRI